MSDDTQDLVDVVIGFRNGREIKVTVEEWATVHGTGEWTALDREHGIRLETIDWDQVDYVLTTKHRRVNR